MAPAATAVARAPAAAAQELTFTTFAEDPFEEDALKQMVGAFSKDKQIRVRLTIIRADGSRVEFAY